MTKKAHITPRVGHQVGDVVLGLCGKEFTVEVLWSAIPKSKRICRQCVDTALAALTDADETINRARRRLVVLQVRLDSLSEMLIPEKEENTHLLDALMALDYAHQMEQEQKAKDAAEELLKQTTCTCTWETMENFAVNPTCPIHGGQDEGELDAIGVDVPEEGAIGVEDTELPDWEPPDSDPSGSAESGGGENP